MAGGQILAFPIDFDRRPYNTLALPCECVIFVLKGGVNLERTNQPTVLKYKVTEKTGQLTAFNQKGANFFQRWCSNTFKM